MMMTMMMIMVVPATGSYSDDSDGADDGEGSHEGYENGVCYEACCVDGSAN